MKEISSDNCYLVSGKKISCCGCRACENICPKAAISMVEDKEGFFYPVIDKKKCVECNLCKKVCPMMKKIESINPKAYSYITSDEQQLLSASSGGAFGDIVNSFFEDKKTFIYGCTFDENNKVIHLGVDNLNDIEQFKKSKYVQSNMLNVYKEIKKKLMDGYKVLFSGTPCQVTALKSFLLKDYDNLLCVDIICHGVPSQKIFDYYLKTEERKNNSKIKKINFREKKLEDNGLYSSKNIKLVFENGTSKILSPNTSSFLKGFSERLFYRPSCSKCKFASINRISDITIADAWGITKYKKCDFHKGASYIILNTEKGIKVFEKMTGDKDEVSTKFIDKNNECYNNPTFFNGNRKKYFKEVTLENFDEITFKYARRPLYVKILFVAKKTLTNIFKG